MKTLFEGLLHALWYDPASAVLWLKILFACLFGVLVLRFLRSWPVLQPIWHAFWVDGTFVRRVLWGIGGFVITLGSMVFAEGVEVAFTWTARQWAGKVVTAVLAMGLTMINPTGKKAGEVAGAPSA